ncbi:MAG: RIP metalloprotease RseP [Deltaproteobacteria bacterium]|nr:RIP metalloprotease RseP [Deltaproteobacteria bacterium]MBW2306287.1 RIP metalloprotease RseP [Deltaproteobacteria bacterium]
MFEQILQLLWTLLSAGIVLGVLIFVHELGHFLLAKRLGVKVLKFSLGFGSRLVSKKIGETEYQISAFPLGGYVKMVGENPEDQVSPEEETRSFSGQRLWKRIAIVVAGPGFNFLFAMVIFSMLFFVGIPSLTTEIGDIRKGFPSEKAGLQPGDVIAAVNGRKIQFWEELSESIRNSQGRPLTFTVLRGEKTFDISISPVNSSGQNLFGEEVSNWIIGISGSSNYINRRFGPLTSIWRGVEQTWKISQLTILSVVKLIQRIIPMDTLGGPILIAQLAGKQAREGILNFFFFMALISVNLGILNLLPIPILDGGHLLFFMIEAVVGVPVKARFREVAQQVGIFLLIVLMAFVFYNDIMRNWKP